MTSRRGRWVALLLVSAAPCTLLACKRRSPDGMAVENRAREKALPPLVLNDETPDLSLTWVDGRGSAHMVSKVADVPTEGRDQVRVEIATSEEGTRDLFYVANLTTKNPDGAYPIATQTRDEWETMIAKRRLDFAAKNAPPAEEGVPGSPGETHGEGEANPQAGAAPKAPSSSFTVIVYGASWCGACHEAMAYLKRRRVPAVEKDIEQDPAAEREMRSKLARAGIHGGSIPVIDVKGKILVGFEPHALDAAMRGASIAL
ncbi:MAG TPA: glutaredoxin domain-containing protein [Polyangiaceae bacterium]|nr:glutaredoxin domain-containing protein [Polyangiaceae bacterium]